MQTLISIDLETLATTPDAIILSIGAAAFETPGLHLQTLNIEVDPEQPGRRLDGGTFRWWLGQSSRKPGPGLPVRDTPTEERTALPEALEKLARFIYHYDSPLDAAGAPTVWGNGAAFDLGILSHAYAQHDQNVPWCYWKERDLRTLRAVAPELPRPAPTVPHKAGDDAEAQGRWIIDMLQAMGV